MVLIKNNIGIRLPQEEKESLAAYAKKQDTTVSQIVRRLIRTYLNQKKENEK